MQFEQHFLLDTTPVIAVGYRRDKSHSDFRGSAEYGYCSARKLKYFGYKLVVLTTLDGTPYAFELVPANTDERDAADEILDSLPPDSNVWYDKGFIGEEWQADWSRQVSMSGRPSAKTKRSRIPVNSSASSIASVNALCLRRIFACDVLTYTVVA